MRLGRLVERLGQGREDRWIAVPEAGHRRAAGGVDVGLAVGIEELDAAAADRDRQAGMDGAMKKVGHALLLDLLPAGAPGVKKTLSAPSRWSPHARAARAAVQPRPAPPPPRIYAPTTARDMLWRNKG